MRFRSQEPSRQEKQRGMQHLTGCKWRKIEEFLYRHLQCLLILTVFFTIVPHLAVIESLKKFDARSVGLILTLQVLYAIIFANLFFDEPLKPSLIIGGVLVIATVVYESISLKIIELRSKIVKR